MKKLRLFAGICSIAILTACGGKEKGITADIVNNPNTANTENTDPANLPVIEFESKEFDFGTIKQGQVVEYVFKFKNTGKADLYITDATGSCGCTVPQYPTKPIRPGESGEISVKFDSGGKSGKQNKTVTVTANTQPSQTVLNVVGTINE